jgi:putative hemolysin
MAKPASSNCGKIDGTTEIKIAADGSRYGMCTFTNGTTREEWALFRGEGCKPYIAVVTTTASK